MNRTQHNAAKSECEISVIIPCYNYGRFLRKCVESVVRNTELNVQLIIIDDASTDDTHAVCAELATEYPDATFVRHDSNIGHIATYNHGLELARGDFVHLISADDLLTPFALDRAIEIMSRHSNVGAVYGRAVPYSSEMHPRFRVSRRVAYSIVSGTDWIEARCRDVRNPIYSPEVTLRATVSSEAGPYDPRLPNLADLEMWLKVAALADIAIIENADQALYRIHERSMHTEQWRRGLIPNLREQADAYEIFFKRQKHLFSDSRRLMELAQKSVARRALQSARCAFDLQLLDKSILPDVIQFAESISAEAPSLKEWTLVARRLNEKSDLSNCRKTIRRFSARATNWLTWYLDKRDAGHRGLRVTYSGRLSGTAPRNRGW